jgi:hypothetical protein
MPALPHHHHHLRCHPAMTSDLGLAPFPVGEPALTSPQHHVAPHTRRSASPPPPPIPTSRDIRSEARFIPHRQATAHFVAAPHSRATVSAKAEDGYTRSRGGQWHGGCGRRTWSSCMGLAYLLIISLKFRRVLDLIAADLDGRSAFSSPPSADHFPPISKQGGAKISISQSLPPSY